MEVQYPAAVPSLGGSVLGGNGAAHTSAGGGASFPSDSGCAVHKMVAGRQVHRVWLALSRLRRRQFDKCVDLCTELLEQNPYDQAVWYIKCRALTLRAWVDDTEMEEEGVADILLDDNAVAQAPRPGTSLARPLSSTASASAGVPDQGVRPITAAGRPLTGFARPGTGSGGGGGGGGGRLGTGSSSSGGGGGVAAAFRSLSRKPGTARPLTTSGRLVRLGTASMLSDPHGPFINVDRLDLRKYAARPALAKVLCDYLLYHEHNPKKALELAALATVSCSFGDWWWKARLGKAYYQLGLLRDAERQFKSALKEQRMVVTTLELGKVFLRLDQPNAALDLYLEGGEAFPGELSFSLGAARVLDALHDLPAAVQHYRQVLRMDGSNVESIASLASNHFYTDQPELALRFYRRLLQMGLNNTELWNNLGLCCFYSGQYDMTLTCFERAIQLATDDNMAEVWYNVGQIAIGIGDLGLAFQAFKVAVSLDANHAESFNNLGVLELRKGNLEQARANFTTAARLGPHLFEPFFNGALLAFKLGDFQESYHLATKSQQAFPNHTDTAELMKQLKSHFTTL